MKLTMLFVIIAAMVIGCHSGSSSMSCTYVNGEERCVRNSGDGNSAHAASSATSGSGGDGFYNHAGTGNTRTGAYDFAQSQGGAPTYHYGYPGYNPYNYAPPNPASFDPFAWVFGNGGGFPRGGSFSGASAWAGRRRK